MKWFGEPWNPRVCDPTERVRVPVDAFCAQCERPILERDQGVMQTISACVVTPDGDVSGFAVRHEPLHLDCFLHSVGVIPCSPRFHPPTKETLS